MATIYILHLQEVGTSYYCSSYSIGFQRFDIIFDPRYEGIGHISLKVVDGIGYCFPFIFFGKIITENLDERLPLDLQSEIFLGEVTAAIVIPKGGVTPFRIENYTVKIE